ncbi:hypothetical protein VTO73DRAFT_12830 [Trametes versicolor]
MQALPDAHATTASASEARITWNTWSVSTPTLGPRPLSTHWWLRLQCAHLPAHYCPACNWSRERSWRLVQWMTVSQDMILPTRGPRTRPLGVYRVPELEYGGSEWDDGGSGSGSEEGEDQCRDATLANLWFAFNAGRRATRVPDHTAPRVTHLPREDPRKPVGQHRPSRDSAGLFVAPGTSTRRKAGKPTALVRFNPADLQRVDTSECDVILEMYVVTSLTALAAAAGFPRNLNVCLKTVCFKIPEQDVPHGLEPPLIHHHLQELPRPLLPIGLEVRPDPTRSEPALHERAQSAQRCTRDGLSSEDEVTPMSRAVHNLSVLRRHMPA